MLCRDIFSALIARYLFFSARLNLCSIMFFEIPQSRNPAVPRNPPINLTTPPPPAFVFCTRLMFLLCFYVAWLSQNNFFPFPQKERLATQGWKLGKEVQIPREATRDLIYPNTTGNQDKSYSRQCRTCLLVVLA